MELAHYFDSDEINKGKPPKQIVWRHLLSATDWDDAEWTGLYVSCESAVHGIYKASCGEGGANGSIGYVALSSNDQADRLHWLLMSMSSNPFISIKIDDSYVISTTSSGFIWKIPIDRPYEAQISPDANYYPEGSSS